MYTVEQRMQVVEAFAQELKKTFPETNQYNVLVFGSFLTERFTETSDIDIGVFSLNPALAFRLYSFTKDYFDNLDFASDVIRMRLSEYQYINIPIVLEQKYAVTEYCPVELIDYIKMMLDKYGENPQETVVRRMRQEVIA